MVFCQGPVIVSYQTVKAIFINQKYQTKYSQKTRMMQSPIYQWQDSLYINLIFSYF